MVGKQVSFALPNLKLNAAVHLPIDPAPLPYLDKMSGAAKDWLLKPDVRRSCCF